MQGGKLYKYFFVGVLRIELSSDAPHAPILPVNYTPITRDQLHPAKLGACTRDGKGPVEAYRLTTP